ncbi:hypothetical protein [Sporomusa termitida]|uniref:hypothetical protein n=1 Tax=Sporomusa termitida TaxID=2377 RepID=UPI00147828FB|nr:hypothetical protein [Sporomusa termitida]
MVREAIKRGEQALAEELKQMVRRIRMLNSKKCPEFCYSKTSGHLCCIPLLSADSILIVSVPFHVLLTSQALRSMRKPEPVRQVAIPKPDRGKEKLGVPAVIDRVIRKLPIASQYCLNFQLLDIMAI